MRPALFKDVGVIRKIQKAKLTDSWGGWVYSPKTGKLYGFGGLYLPNVKVGDNVNIVVSFERIIELKED